MSIGYEPSSVSRELPAVDGEPTPMVAERISSLEGVLGDLAAESAESLAIVAELSTIYIEETGRLNDALRLLNTTPIGKNAILNWNMARAYVGVGEPGDAFTFAERAVKSEPDNAPMVITLARIHQNLGWDIMANQHYSEALEIDPNGFDSNFYFGAFLLTRGEPDTAVELLLVAVEANPDNRAALLSLANAQAAAGHPEQALEITDSLLDSQFEDPGAHIIRGSALLAMGHLGLAIGSFQTAVDLEPESKGYKGLSEAYAMLAEQVDS